MEWASGTKMFKYLVWAYVLERTKKENDFPVWLSSDSSITQSSTINNKIGVSNCASFSKKKSRFALRIAYVCRQRSSYERWFVYESAGYDSS